MTLLCYWRFEAIKKPQPKEGALVTLTGAKSNHILKVLMALKALE